MKRRTSKTLYHLLPIVFWLLAAGVSVALPFLVSISSPLLPADSIPYWASFGIAGVVLGLFAAIRRIERNSTALELSFVMAVLLGICSYWMPTILLLILPIWIYLILRRSFSAQTASACLIGLTLVAIYAGGFIYLGWIGNPWSRFFAAEYAWGWIPVGLAIIANYFSTIARRNLRVR